MRQRLLLSYPFLVTLLIAGSCQPLELEPVAETYLDLPAVRYNYNNFTDSTNAISTLGRVLFYDRQLSINNTIACASCHKQSAAFADNEQFSRGFEGKLTSRNSMPIQNVDLINFALFSSSSIVPTFAPSPNSSPFFGQHLFWDGRESSIERLVLQPVGNHVEMGIKDVDALASKLSSIPYYQPLFTDAFHSPEITSQKISLALSTFIRSIRTSNTRFDMHNFTRLALESAQPGPLVASDLTPLELEGMKLFDEKYNCNSCHQVTSPVGYIMAGTFANIGLDKAYADNGLAEVTHNPADAGKFKIPSLRNVSYTAPYMHDGRFKTLEEVIHHYSEGMADHPNLDERLRKNGTAQSMNISEHETQAIIAFLRTLDDESVLTDPKFSNPFKTR